MAAVLFNVILIATNVPLVVDALRASQVGSFGLDMTWLLSGFILWMPICCAIPEISGRSYPVKMVYLFLAAATVPMVPGGFLTFADHPLYATYELAPRVMGFSALNDQQLAGAFMKVGNIPVIWSVIAVMFVRWWKQERASDEARAKDHPAESWRLRRAGLGPTPPGHRLRAGPGPQAGAPRPHPLARSPAPGRRRSGDVDGDGDGLARVAGVAGDAHLQRAGLHDPSLDRVPVAQHSRVERHLHRHGRAGLDGLLGGTGEDPAGAIDARRRPGT